MRDPYLWPRVDALFAMAGMPPMAVPIGGARAVQKITTERERHEALRHEMETVRQEAALAKVQTTVEAPPAPASPPPAPASPPPWGTREARRLEIERIRQQIAENAAKRARDGDPSQSS